jgi:hypothetical protein
MFRFGDKPTREKAVPLLAKCLDNVGEEFARAGG